MDNSVAMGGITQETIDQTRQILNAGAMNLRLPTSTKAITVAGDVLYGFPLEAPSKKLYPVEDTMRRRIPRYVNPTGGIAAHWKQITAINTAGVKAGVAEGALNTQITLTDQLMAAVYKTLNMSNSYSDEARFMGRRFEDIPSYTMLATLQSLMIQEDRYIIGGNQTALGAPAGLAATGATTTGGALVSATLYDVAVSALTLHGYLNSIKGKVSGAVDNDDESAATTLASATPGGAFNSLVVTWTDIPGAFAYNVYISLHATATPFYSKTVTVNTATILANKTSGNVPNAADQTADNLGYSGILEQLTLGGATGAYYASYAGAGIHGDNAAGITEIDAALVSIWNTARIGPTVILVNSQEALSIKHLAIGASATNATRVMVTMDGQSEFKAGAGVSAYWNPFTAQWIPIIVSVHMPPGTIMLIGERVPYPNSETPNNLEVELQQEYYGEAFARVARSQPIGVTCIGALKVYFPPACGIIKNVVAS